MGALGGSGGEGLETKAGLQKAVLLAVTERRFWAGEAQAFTHVFQSRRASYQGKGKFFSSQMCGRPPRPLRLFAANSGQRRKGTPHPRVSAAASAYPALSGGGRRAGAVTHCFLIPTDAQKLPFETLISCCSNLTYSAGEHVAVRASLSDFITSNNNPVAGATDKSSVPSQQYQHTFTLTHTHTPARNFRAKDEKRQVIQQPNNSKRKSCFQLC